MSWLRGFMLAGVVGSLVLGCEAQDAPDQEIEGTVQQAITAACSTDTIGLPCDPDGPAQPKLECEGVCGINTSGLVVCQDVPTGTLDGVVCGTTNGVGANACKRHCSGKTCLQSNAPAGSACRPNSGASPCEGQCDGAGACQAVVDPCPFGRDEQLCTFATCDFLNATDCLTDNLLRNTLCSDQDVCSIGKCNNKGACVAGPTLGCDDGNPCTDDGCDEEDGGCVGINNDANSCSDGNACTTGEHCSAGGCIAGTVKVDCDDNNACTADTCDPNTGCANIPKNCSDGDACTDDTCDTGNGVCGHSSKTCQDNNPCTIDSCDSGTGCQFTAMNCDDNNACTADSCSAGECLHDAISCDDLDPCTVDTCAAIGGCDHAVVAGCGGGGGAPSDGGAPSTGGTSSEGGAPPDGAGAPNDGGAPTSGGVPSDGGAGAPDSGAGEGPVAEGGQPAAGGTSAGGTPSGGTAGSNATGGVGAVGATAGTSSGATAGTSTDGGSAPQGASSQGGSAEAGSNSAARSVEDGGCGCRAAGGERSSSPVWALVAAVAAAGLRRRQRAA